MVGLFLLALLLGAGWAVVRQRASLSALRAVPAPSPVALWVAIAAGASQILVALLPSSVRHRVGFVAVLVAAAAVSAALASYAFRCSWIRRAGAAVVTGGALNLLVIGLNGSMPVSRAGADFMNWDPDGPADIFAKHELLTDSTRLPFLGDVIPVRLILERTVISVGDIVLLVGIALLTHDALIRTAPHSARALDETSTSISTQRGEVNQ